MKEANPTLGAQEIIKKIGSAWNALDEATKKNYANKAIEDRERYNRELAEETKNNGGKKLPMKADVTKFNKEVSKNGGGKPGALVKGVKKERIQSTRAKQPLTPFFIYLKMRRQQLKDDPVRTSNVTTFTKSISEEWNHLSKEEKLKYKHDGEYGKRVMEESDRLEAEKRANPPKQSTQKVQSSPSTPDTQCTDQMQELQLNIT
jgi:hypothetical protein